MQLSFKWRRQLSVVAMAVFVSIGPLLVLPTTPAAAETTRDRIVQVATAEYNNDGRNHEVNGSGTSDCNFYTGAMGRPSSRCPISGWGDVDWCADFVRYVWKTAGNIAHLGDLDSFAHSLRRYGLDHDTWHSAGSGYIPQPGDAFTEKDQNGNGLADHTGLVVSSNGNGDFTTIEGNSPDRIARNTRNVNDGDLWGFSSPVLTTPDNPAPVVQRVGVSGVSFGGRFHEFFRRGDDSVIHHVYTPGGAGWDADKNIAGSIISGPVATVHNGSMFVFARGSDGELKYRFHTGDAWDANWRTVPGGFSGTPALAVRGQRMFVFIRTGGRVVLRYHDAGVGWNADGVWKSLGEPSSTVTAVSDPVTVFFNDRMYVFVRGSDGRIWARYLSSGDAPVWSGWAALAGVVEGQPVAAEHGNRVFVFARTASNQILYHYNTVGAAGWTTNRNLHGDVRGNPAAVSAGGTLLVYARTPAGEIAYRANDGQAWNDFATDPTRWRALGRHSAAVIDSSPVAFRQYDSAVVAARGADARLYSRTLNPATGWNAWGALPGNHILNP
jgi:hypothetical protein